MLDTDRRTAFAQAFSDAIAARGASLSWLHRRLADNATPISIATLSYWRSGERHPEGTRSLIALEEIEFQLGMTPGTLLDLVSERSRLGSLSPAQEPFSEDEVRSAVAETMRILDAPPLDITRELSAHIVSDVGPDGLLRHRTSQLLIQAVAPHVREVTYSLISASNTVRRPRCTLRGATLVREHLHESEHVYTCVLRLDEPLEVGATTMLEIAMAAAPETLHRGPAHEETGAFVTRPIRDLVLWTRFHPDAVPDWVEEFERATATDEIECRPLRPRRSLHQSRRDFGPGILGVRWGFDD